MDPSGTVAVPVCLVRCLDFCRHGVSAVSPSSLGEKFETREHQTLNLLPPYGVVVYAENQKV